jgi:hypothetical protein
MDKSSKKFIGTAEYAAEFGIGYGSAWRTCKNNPGFAIRPGAEFLIPREHVERVKRGETPAAIAAGVRSNGGPTAE